jgi:hypothetical protein
MEAVNPAIDAELDKRGRAAIAAMLTEAVGANRGATVRLWVQGLPDPDRAYVEDWLGRKEAEEAALAARRHEEALKPAQDAARWAWWACVIGGAALVVSLIALLK